MEFIDLMGNVSGSADVVDFKNKSQQENKKGPLYMWERIQGAPRTADLPPATMGRWREGARLPYGSTTCGPSPRFRPASSELR